ncbi:hypothetical protein Ciccas_014028 [Cichlidogyrus casuarinus]|uniref:ABC transmembrane type-1 domain-containing protein n=1 Tax=Cichlidogyrus casuarinus TaxID=1844966 RepID=A0ABD2PJ41_9PLAT
MSWFDREENRAGVLTAILAADVPKIHNVSVTTISVVTESLVLIILMIALGFTYSWQITLLTLAFIPFMLLGAKTHRANLHGGRKRDDSDVKSAMIAHESLSNHATVTAYSLENHYQKLYDDTLKYS